MKRGFKFFICLSLLLLMSLNNAFAQRGGAAQVIDVRLASPLPRNSDWGRGLDRMAAEWARVTNNQVRLRIIHDGLEGGESKMLSSMNSNNIQAALFVSTGLSEVCPAIMTLSIPFLIRNNDELDVVLKDTLPYLDNQMNKTNFAVVSWSKGGWVYFLSKEAVLTPDELRRQRLGTSADLKDINAMFRTMGFQAVESDLVDIGTKLANNMVNATYLIPEAIAPMGLHRYLTNMLDMPIAPFLAAVIINRVTWNKISAEHKTEIIKVTQRVISDFEASMAKANANAISSMQRDGLKVNKPSPAQEDMWRSEVNKAIPVLLETTYDRVLYNQINGILERSRARQ